MKYILIEYSIRDRERDKERESDRLIVRACADLKGRRFGRDAAQVKAHTHKHTKETEQSGFYQ